MREGISLQTRREFLQHLLPQYREATTVKKKSRLLDATTRSHWLQSQVRHGAAQPCASRAIYPSTPQRSRPRHYGPEVQHALFLAWHAANRICAKRLIPFLPTMVKALERYEHLQIS